MAEPLDNPKPPKGYFFLASKLYKRKTWYRDSNMRLLYFYILCLIVTNTANGFDNSMMNGLQSLTYFQEYFHHPKGPTLGLFNCVMSAGSLAGLVFLPFVMDRIGRKPTLVVGSLIMLLGIGLQAGARNFSMFVGARFILGFGDIICICTVPLLVAEIAPAQDRAILVTICGATYFTGAFIAAWTTYGTLQIQSDWSWRAPSLIQAVFTLFMLCVLYWIPESPRFLVARDQSERARAMLARFHGGGDENDEVVQVELVEITTALALERAAERQSSFLDFVRTPGNRRRLVILLSIGVFSQLSGNGLVGYYLNLILDNIGITDAQTQLQYNGGITTFNLVTNLFFCAFVDKWGRRPIYLYSTMLMLVCFVIWTILQARYTMHPQAGLGRGVISMIFIYNLGYNIKSGLLSTYATEILPYAMRAKGYTVMEYALYATLFFNQYVNPIALDNIGWRYYVFYCVFLGFEVVVIYIFYVETKYVPLEEVAKYFDGEDVAAVTNMELKRTEQGAVTQVETA